MYMQDKGQQLSVVWASTHASTTEAYLGCARDGATDRTQGADHVGLHFPHLPPALHIGGRYG